MESVDSSVEIFIQQNLPEPNNRMDTYEEFIRREIQWHQALCSEVIKEVENALDPLKKKYDKRFFYRIDSSNQSKSPLRIIEKIMTSQAAEGGAEYTVENFPKKMKDLARFRVVCNFLNDVIQVKETVKSWKPIYENFEIHEKSTIEDRPNNRKSGERSVKLTLRYRYEPKIYLEIQIMTQLQEAWDKKDHPIVYEKRRKSNADIPPWLTGMMLSMAELLYVADQYFDEIRQSEEKVS